MEFLIGRSLVNNIINLLVEPVVRRSRQRRGQLDWLDLLEQEPDAGLGNGGLGGLAACFIDSLATLQIPAMGYGLRYEYGIFRQTIENGYQVEQPDNWLARPDPWEVARPGESGPRCRLNCSLRAARRRLARRPRPALHTCSACPTTGRSSATAARRSTRCGCGGRRARLLRLRRVQLRRLRRRGRGDRDCAKPLTRVLYPDDSTIAGQALRFVQEYFLVCCSLGDIVARFRRTNNDWQRCPTRSPSSSTTRTRRWPSPS